jgi:hypothetical protein
MLISKARLLASFSNFQPGVPASHLLFETFGVHSPIRSILKNMFEK